MSISRAKGLIKSEEVSETYKMRNLYSIFISIVRRVYWGQLDNSGITL